MRRARTLALLVPLVAVLLAIGWSVSSSGDADVPGTADGATSTSAAVSAQPTDAPSDAPSPSAPTPAAPPTEMPDGSPIPAPSPGTPQSVGKGATVPVEPVEVRPAVELDKPGDFGTGLVAGITAIEATQGVARAPGEVAGPAIKVSVEATNSSADAISLEGVVVFLSYGEDRTPAAEFRDGSSPLAGDLAGGAGATGIYVFAVPEDQRGDIRVEVSYTGEAPTLAFEGSAA